MSDALAVLTTMAAALDGLDVAMCAFDAQDRTQLWNRAFLRCFPEHAGHVHAGEAYRANLRRFYESRLDATEIASIERYVEEGIERHRAQRRPYMFQHRGVWLQVASLPLPGGGRVRVWSRGTRSWLGETEAALLGSTGNATDNTEVFEHVGDGVLLASAENRITWVNQHLVQMLSLADKAAAIGRSFEDAYSIAWGGVWGSVSGGAAASPSIGDRNAEAALFERGLATLTENLRFAGAPFELPLPGGRWVRVVEQRRRDGVGFFAFVDISELKRQQQELIAAERRARDSEARLAQKSRILEITLERMEQGVMMVGADQTVEVCNRRAIELLGLPVELMAAKPSFAQVLAFQWASDEFVHTPEHLRRFVRAGGILDQPHAYDRERPDGSVVEVHSVPIEGGGVLRTYTDVTERKRAEQTQRVLEAQLREAQKLEAIGTLAGGIAHDFNNIMAAILGNVAFAAEAVGSGSPAQAFLDQIGMAGRRARSLVQQILAFSRKRSNEFTPVALQPLVDETLGLLAGMAGASVRLQPVHPERPLAVRGDATQLQQVLMNLGTNALQALQGSGGLVEIGCEGITLQDAALPLWPAGPVAGDFARVWVHDNGCGMQDAVRRRIFEPFFTTKPVGEGTGLGLAVAHGIVEAHGGGIAVHSAAGGGSTFSVYLPLAALPAAPRAGAGTASTAETVGTSGTPDAPGTPGAPGAAAAPPRGQGQHVLYIDDDEVMAVMVQGLLERLGYRATVSTAPEQAIALVARDPTAFEFVVTDFNMPRVSGLDVVRALAGIRPGLPVAISSGYVSDDLRSSAAALGVFGLIHKERTLEELGALVHAALGDAPPLRRDG